MISAARLLFSKFGWQIGGAAAALSLIVVSGFLIAASVENRRITEENRVLDDRITNATTGYVVRLAQAETNVVTVRTALEKQVADLRATAEAAEARLRQTEVALADAQRETREARRAANEILRDRPQGETLEDRVLDIDQRILESLK